MTIMVICLLVLLFCTILPIAAFVATAAGGFLAAAAVLSVPFLLTRIIMLIDRHQNSHAVEMTSANVSVIPAGLPKYETASIPAFSSGIQ
jgi:hypothetical protein